MDAIETSAIATLWLLSTFSAALLTCGALLALSA